MKALKSPRWIVVCSIIGIVHSCSSGWAAVIQTVSPDSQVLTGVTTFNANSIFKAGSIYADPNDNYYTAITFNNLKILDYPNQTFSELRPDLLDFTKTESLINNYYDWYDEWGRYSFLSSNSVAKFGSVTTPKGLMFYINHFSEDSSQSGWDENSWDSQYHNSNQTALGKVSPRGGGGLDFYGENTVVYTDNGNTGDIMLQSYPEYVFHTQDRLNTYIPATLEDAKVPMMILGGYYNSLNLQNPGTAANATSSIELNPLNQTIRAGVGSDAVTLNGHNKTISLGSGTNSIFMNGANGRITLNGPGSGVYAGANPVFSMDTAGKVNFGSTSPAVISNSSQSTSASSGALTVVGGLGVGKDAFISGKLTAGTITAGKVILTAPSGGIDMGVFNQ